MGEQSEEMKSGFASKWRDSGSGDAQKTENTSEWSKAGTMMDTEAKATDTAGVEQEDNYKQEEDSCEQSVLGTEQNTVGTESDAAKPDNGGTDMAETIEKVKKFLLDNKDILILSGQLALVALVCVVGIKNDLTPDRCCKKRRKKKRK